MKTSAIKKRLAAAISLCLYCFSAAAAQNTISGIIFDADRRPVAKIDVELLDEFERLMRTTKTNGSGLYFFQGLRAGNYYVQVRTDGTNYKSAKERVQLGQSNRINSTTGNLSGLENIQVNFALEVDRRGDRTPTSNDVVFAQNVPREAESFYRSALRKIADKKSAEAIADLAAAVGVFPEYFLALDRLGYEYLAAGKFAEAESAFAKAAAVNPKSFSSRSGLGIALFKLGRKREAAAALEEAVRLDQAAPNAFLFLGKVYRELENYAAAETNLRKAAELGDYRFADAHWELALLYYHDLGRPAEAAAELERYLQAKPKADNRAQIEKLIKTMREEAKRKN